MRVRDLENALESVLAHDDPSGFDLMMRRARSMPVERRVACWRKLQAIADVVDIVERRDPDGLLALEVANEINRAAPNTKVSDGRKE